MIIVGLPDVRLHLEVDKAHTHILIWKAATFLHRRVQSARRMEKSAASCRRGSFSFSRPSKGFLAFYRASSRHLYTFLGVHMLIGCLYKKGMN